jgi:hypothetical protein
VRDPVAERLRAHHIGEEESDGAALLSRDATGLLGLPTRLNGGRNQLVGGFGTVTMVEY